jgi:hypothetical protein
MLRPPFSVVGVKLTAFMRFGLVGIPFSPHEEVEDEQKRSTNACNPLLCHVWNFYNPLVEGHDWSAHDEHADEPAKEQTVERHYETAKHRSVSQKSEHRSATLT